MSIILPATESIKQQVQYALAEDIGDGDVTAQLINIEQQAHATVISREAGILAGSAWFNLVFQQLAPDINIHWLLSDGAIIQANQEICTFSGSARTLLTGERTALNFLQLLSGTATTVHQYVQAISGSNTKLLDTRKTIPGLRDAQKYAVRCGGGENHRIGLYDMVLIKENHIASAGSITLALHAAQRLYPNLPIEVEIEQLNELEEALKAGAKRILLDNMPNDILRQAVKMNQSRAKLEASGNVTIDTIHDIARTGVDYISIGATTKHLKALDLSMILTAI
ncbi:Quinolinate phosphoribosyltransferase [decarboxylating] [hydrothermal vent metagenome]|uniref:Probable nicotinate-nucleotide pyrophosphorylase [carboxylating] n=1 Tax=hydrothermal vent metagenome TaxID=652676 RepID=A0A3B1ABI1_9ZZZZ